MEGKIANDTQGTKKRGSERETVINFNEEDDMVSIWTASQPLYRRATTPMCEYCRAQPATEGVYCDNACWK
jgi:hypothetical protein